MYEMTLLYQTWDIFRANTATSARMCGMEREAAASKCCSQDFNADHYNHLAFISCVSV